VAARRRVGHWEGDPRSGAGGRRAALISLPERKSRYTVLGHIDRGTAEAARTENIARLKPHAPRGQTLTCDNGQGFAEPERLGADLDADIYFAPPYAAWERGTNENTNGLLRQYFPRRRDLASVTEAELRHAMHRLNHRPRKCLGFRTPHEVFFNTTTSLTVALQS
jgi:IS30 family transposase